MANSPAESLTISTADTVGGNKYSLVMFERALPNDTLEVGGSMRTEFTWYAGSPVATVQVLGSEENDITLNGFWKERFIGEPTTGGMIFVDGTATYSVSDAVDALDAMRRRGQVVQLLWGNICRTAIITSFKQTWHNRYDCEWELTLGVIAIDNITQPVGNPKYANLADARANINTEATYWSELALQIPSGLRWDALLLAALSDLDDFLLGTTNYIGDLVQDVVSQATTPLNASRQLGSILTQAIAQTENLAFNIMGDAESSIFEGFTDPDNITYTQQAQASYSKTRISAATRDLRNVFIENIVPQIQLLAPPLTAAYIASEAQDLRDVSTLFYGTPNNWRALMQYNRLPSSRLSAGDLIWVPQQINVDGGAGA